MLEFFKTINNQVKKLDAFESECWVNVVAPTEEEKKYLIESLGVLPEFIRQALDEEESPHIDYDDDILQRLIMVDFPLMTKQVGTENNMPFQYMTCPLGFISYKDFIVTISNHENQEIADFKSGVTKNINTNMKTRFFLTLMLKISQRFLLYLRQIDRLSSLTEQELHKSMQNNELIQMLGLEKSLVYFSTSLKTDEIIMNKILRGKIIKLYEDDQDLLDDVLIEVHQAIEMCNIYSNILSGTMDAFASIISNNLNIVMKVLTIITIVMSIPNMVFGFYGMNTKDELPWAYWFVPIIISIVLCVITTIIFRKKKMFR